MRLRSLAALTLVLALAVSLAAHHYWSQRPRTVAAPARETGSAAVPRPPLVPAAGQGSAGPPASMPAEGRRIVVDVAGKVRDPGIHELQPGARVEDALRAAGGVRPGTELTGLNRARLLGDGEQLVVGGNPTLPPPPGTAGAPGPPGAPGTAPGGPVSLNSATAEQLETLPGIGPVLAQHILEYRDRHGGFTSVDDLREVNGIGERRFADLRSRVTP